MKEASLNLCLGSERLLENPLLSPTGHLLPIKSSNEQNNCRFVLDESKGILQLFDTLNPHQHPLTSLDLIQEWHKRVRSLRGKQEPLAKALGLHKRALTGQVVDTTAGLGRDSIVMASLGAQVIMLERELPIACLLHQALDLAQKETWFAPFSQNIEFHHRDTIHFLSEAGLNESETGHELGNLISAWYCDPMFNHKANKTANNKRPVQMLQQVCDKDPEMDLPALLLSHMQPGQKLIVKRALQDTHLGQYLNHQMKGKNFRFDIHYRPMI